LTNYSTIAVVEGSYDSAEWQSLAIAPYLTDFTPTSIEIDLQFRYPLQISGGSYPDSVIFTLTDPSLFIDAENGLPIEPFTRVLYLPKLLNTNSAVLEQEIQTIEETGQTFAKITNVSIIGLLLFSLILATSRKGLWIFIHFAQVVYYLRYFSPNMPANVLKMFNYINYSINLKWLGY